MFNLQPVFQLPAVMSAGVYANQSCIAQFVYLPLSVAIYPADTSATTLGNNNNNNNNNISNTKDIVYAAINVIMAKPL